ncbi:MAG: phenylalanine--tRNA ligase subunit beta, partial [Acidobacteriota bacterium]
TSLLPGILRNIHDNARHFSDFRLFEIGREVHPDHESPHIVATIFSKEAASGSANLLELKRLAECLLPSAQIRPTSDVRGFEHPHRAANVLANGTIIGRLFEFHPNKVEQGRAAVLDLDLTLLEQAQAIAVRYQPLRRFPESAFDLSVVAPARALVADVQGALQTLAGPSLLTIDFLRDFALPTGERSLSYRMTMGAVDRTLSTEEVGVIRSAIIDGMRSAGYELRV